MIAVFGIMPYRCCVSGCKNTGSKDIAAVNVSFHSFPKDESIRDVWVAALGLGKMPAKFSKVCSEHFQAKDFVMIGDRRRRLAANAVPQTFSKPSSAQTGKVKKTTTAAAAAVTTAAQDAVPILPKVLNVDREVDATVKENMATMLSSLEIANAKLRRVNRRLQARLDANSTMCGACIQFRAERDFLFKKLEDITNKGTAGKKCTDAPNCYHQMMFSDAVKEIGRLNEVISQLAQQNNAANEGTSPSENAEMPSWTSGQRESPPLEPERNFDTLNSFEAIAVKQEPPDVPDMSEENEYILPDAGEEEEEEEQEPESRDVVKVKQEPKIIPENAFGDCVVPINEYIANENETLTMNEKARFYSIASRSSASGDYQSMSEAIEAAKKNAEKQASSQKPSGEHVAVPQTEAINSEQTENLAMVTRPMILNTAFGHFYVTPGVVRLKKVKKTKPVETTGKDSEPAVEVERAGSCEVAMGDDAERTAEISRVEEDSDNTGEHICKWTKPEGAKMCGRRFKTSDRLAKHAIRHVMQDPLASYKCYWEDCPRNGSVFRLKSSLMSHIGTHTSECTFRCQRPGCYTVHADAAALAAHNEKHDRFKCKYLECGKTFASAGSRAVHYLGHHPKPTSIKCWFANCGEVFQSYGAYVKHTRNHGGVKPLPCPFKDCGERFAFKSALKQHVRVHQTKKTE